MTPEVLAVVVMKLHIFWDMMLCQLDAEDGGSKQYNSNYSVNTYSKRRIFVITHAKEYSYPQTAKTSARTGSLFSEWNNIYKTVLSVWDKNEVNIKSPCYPFNIHRTQS